MKRSGKSVANKIERKIIEKNRRIRMKGLCFKLVSLIPDHIFKTAKEFSSHLDQLEQAAAYIKILRGRIEELERRKREAMMKMATNSNGLKNAANMGEISELPILKIKDLGCDLEVLLISGLKKKFTLHQIITILEDGGAQVVSLNLATVGDKIFHTLLAKVKFPRVGVDTSRITTRMHELIL
ncbi:transcription factor bHLH162-like [Salvia miltiorrhiza]|uniref:transcription factor bHLH162-like n=1 Tax=Salvia miltiorrhiza TaxID=226208 RepID=UPI0025AC68A3|nr:transcription factor bHLH162-like [Salvia miltiorrhiza]